MITKEQRLDFINKYCEVKEESFPDMGDKMMVVNMNGCYLTLGRTIDKIAEDVTIIDFLIKNEITQVESIYHSKVACVGYAPKRNKWWGWSHRGAYSFTIGSEVKKGDCAYNPANKEDHEANELAFWAGPEEGIENARIEHSKGKGYIVGMYSLDPEKIPNERLRGKTYLHEIDYPEKYGRGEWIAHTLDDAHQMAIDYATNVG